MVWFALFVALLAAAWYFEEIADNGKQVLLDGKQIIAADGDSFTIGGRKFRLDGIDAPEYGQTCKDARGAAWKCGNAARASLEQMLQAPGLACHAVAQDRYSRSVANCSNAGIPDLAAAQVALGWAVSDEYYGVRSYGDEEDGARAARRGIWAGEFVQPSDWRKLNTAR